MQRFITKHVKSVDKLIVMLQTHLKFRDQCIICQSKTAKTNLSLKHNYLQRHLQVHLALQKDTQTCS